MFDLLPQQMAAAALPILATQTEKLRSSHDMALTRTEDGQWAKLLVLH